MTEPRITLTPVGVPWVTIARQEWRGGPIVRVDEEDPMQLGILTLPSGARLPIACTPDDWHALAAALSATETADIGEVSP